MRRILRAASVLTMLVTCQSSMASSQAHQFDVPSGFAPVTPLVRKLEAAGLTVQRIENGQQERMFPNLRTSAFIETDRGDVKVAVFASDVQTERIVLTYSRDSRRGTHEYKLDGIGTRVGITVTSGVPLYFTIDRGWLVETRDGAMDLLVKRALGQASEEPQATHLVPR